MSSHGITPKAPEISLDECVAIVEKKFKNFTVVDYKLIALDTKNGFLGDHRRLLIKIRNESGEETQMHCFAKFLPENQSQIDFAITCGVFKKELFIYDTLFPRIINSGIDYLLQCVPECYLTKDNYVLIFEDATNRGFKPLSKFGYLDYDHVIVILKSMVKLHASSLIFEEKLSKKFKPYRLTDEYLDYFYETFYVNDPNHKGGQGLRASLKALNIGIILFPEDFNKTGNNFESKVHKTSLNVYELVKPSEKYRNVICHGDLWSSNVLIKYKNEKPSHCVLIDFQTARYLPPGHDFTSFIYLTTSREFRKEHFHNLQVIYYKELEKLLKEYNYNLKTLIPFEEFLATCEEHKPFALIQTVTYCQLTQAKDKWIMECAKDNDLWEEFLYRDRSIMVIENCKMDSNYKYVFQEALKDLKEYCDSID